MKKIILLATSLMIIPGCATRAPDFGEGVRFSKESQERPEYNNDFWECDRIARDGQANVKNNAIGTAALGAGMGAITGKIMGFGSGELATMGAVHGGAHGAISAHAYNSNNYSETLKLCMRDRGYHAY